MSPTMSIQAPALKRVAARTFKTGDWVKFATRHRDHSPGTNLTIGMTGRVVRVLRADELKDPHPGETGRIEVEFFSKIGGAFTEWLWSSEAVPHVR